MIIVGKTVVYGSSLDAYCCVQMLLSMGLSGDKIVMIHPPTQYEVMFLQYLHANYFAMEEPSYC